LLRQAAEPTRQRAVGARSQRERDYIDALTVSLPETQTEWLTTANR
jgi:hypothetical protein